MHVHYTTLITTHPYKKTTKLRFSKGFHQYSSLFNGHEFADYNKHAQLSSSKT